jgi:hypothetical protein
MARGPFSLHPAPPSQSHLLSSVFPLCCPPPRRNPRCRPRPCLCGGQRRHRRPPHSRPRHQHRASFTSAPHRFLSPHPPPSSAPACDISRRPHPAAQQICTPNTLPSAMPVCTPNLGHHRLPRGPPLTSLYDPRSLALHLLCLRRIRRHPLCAQ